MKSNRKTRQTMAARRRAPIKTSILELVQALSNMTSDDNLVIAAVRTIFGAYNVRLAGAPVPVRLVNSDMAEWTDLKRSQRRKSAR